MVGKAFSAQTPINPEKIGNAIVNVWTLDNEVNCVPTVKYQLVINVSLLTTAAAALISPTKAELDAKIDCFCDIPIGIFLHLPKTKSNLANDIF